MTRTKAAMIAAALVLSACDTEGALSRHFADGAAPGVEPLPAPALLTCDELRAGRDHALRLSISEGIGIETRKGFATAALAWTEAAAECSGR